MADPVDWRFDPFTESYSAVKQDDEDVEVPAGSPYRVRLNEAPRQDSPSTVEAAILVQLDEALDASETGVDVVAAHYARVDVNDIILVDSEQMEVTAKPGSPTLTVTRGYGGTTPATHTTSTWMEILNSLTEVTSGSPASREFRVDYKYNTGLVLFNSAQAGYDVRFDYYGLGSPLHATDVVGPSMMQDNSLPLLYAPDEYNTVNLTWTSVFGAKIYIPAGAGTLRVSGQFLRNGSSDSWAQLIVGALNSSDLAISWGTYAWDTSITLDVSSLSGWQELYMQLKSYSNSYAVNCKFVHITWE